jgi:16S rRNA processing protein RimM
MADWDDMAVVGRITRPHGLRGDVVVNPETDFVEERFRAGATFWTRTAAGDERLTITAARVQQGRPVVHFDGFDSIEAVEELAGRELRIPVDDLQPLEPGTFYHHQLTGCVVETVDGEVVGEVRRVEGGAGGSRLIVEGRRGEVQIPLAVDICVGIDVDARRIRVSPPEGLLELNDTAATRLRAVRSGEVSPKPSA